MTRLRHLSVLTPTPPLHKVMTKVEVLTLSSIFGLVSPKGAYLLAYAWLYGMCRCYASNIKLSLIILHLALWVTFFGVRFNLFSKIFSRLC